MQFEDINVEGLNGFFDEGEENLLQQESTPAHVKESISRKAYANYNPAKSPELLELLREREHIPSFLMEDEARRERWDWAFRSKQFNENKNGLLRRATEVVMDNTWQYLATEYLQDQRFLHMSPRQFFENITTASFDTFVRSALQVVRRLVPRLLYTNLFNVIPTTQPNTKVPFLKRKYGETHTGASHAAGDELWPYNGSGYDYYYAGARKVGEAVGTGDGATTDFDLGFSPTYAHKIYIDGVLQVLTTDYTISTGTGTGGVDEVSFTAAPGIGEVITATYDNQVEGTAGREIDVTVDLEEIEGDVMKLKTSWTLEAEQNLRAYYGINAPSEFPRILSEEIYQAFDGVVMQDAINEATAGDTVFDATAYLGGDTSSADRKAYDRKLYDALVTSSQDLYELHGRWPTFIVAGLGVAEALMKLEHFHANPANNIRSMQNDGRFDLEQRALRGFVGNGRWILYQSSKIPTNRALLGWPSTSPFMMGYVITVFLPFFVTPPIWKDDASMSRAQGAMARVGRKMIDSTQYSTLTVQNL